MNLRKLSLLGAALLVSVPAFATTYYGGFEDLAVISDYDYNDIVFTLSGNGLTLNTSDGHWYNKPTLGTSGTPFWNNSSWDGTAKNIGYCVYGGGNCGAGLSSTAQYLADNTRHTGSANDVTFSVDPKQKVTADIDMEITAGSDMLGYYNVSNADNIHWLNTHGQTGDFKFTPTGNFGLVAENSLGQKFYSQTNYDCLQDDVSHFAFFGDNAAAPEPGAVGLMGGGLLVTGALFRRRKARA
jgi:hypothetical protein